MANWLLLKENESEVKRRRVPFHFGPLDSNNKRRCVQLESIPTLPVHSNLFTVNLMFFGIV
jgi:hypothetical protein